MMDVILALGLLFTTASQLRLPGVPVGPGELGLLVWIAATGGRLLLSGTRLRQRALSDLFLFWTIFALALSVGMMTAMATGEEFDLGLMMHDVAAYALVAVASCLCATPLVRLRRVCWILVISGAVSLSLQFAHGMGSISVPGVDPWFWERFRGWSENPNQLAVVCLIVALLAWYQADTAASFAARIAALLALIPAIVVGRMSQSDTFTAALVAAVPGWFVVKVIAWTRAERHKSSLHASLGRLALLALPLLLLSVAPVVLSEAEDIKRFAMGFAKNGGVEAADEANLRITLWHQAFERGLESAMLGLGPGPHLEIPEEIVAGRVNTVQPANTSHPTQNGTANFEAHNTLLDVFTQGGLLAVASLAWLLLRALWCAWRARSAGLVSLLVGVVIFLTTGNIVRHPIVWFAVVLCLTAPAAARALSPGASAATFTPMPPPPRERRSVPAPAPTQRRR
jgi:hypothetical protein